MLAIQVGTLKTLCKCESDAAVDSDLTLVEQPTVTVKCFDCAAKKTVLAFFINIKLTYLISYFLLASTC
jgi:hypothetical protein